MPRGNIKMTYFLQYGTSITDRTLDRRIDTLRLEGQGKLQGWRLAFNGPSGQANLVEDAQSAVWGLLYLVEEHKLPELDQNEGGQRHQGICSFEGHQEACVFYLNPAGPDKPGAEYLAQLREAYRQASLPQGQIDKALALIKA